MPKLITVTNMVRSFSDIVGRVYYKGETFDIKKGANVVARLSPVKEKTTVSVKELNTFFKDLPHLDKEDSNELMESLLEVRKLKEDLGVKKWD